MERSAGILMPIFSLPNQYGIGCFSKEAYQFVDFLERAGQRWWQILPLHPTGFGDSPYQSFSVFAGNPYFIDLEGLVAEGVLTEAECSRAGLENSEDAVDYKLQYEKRYGLLRKAYERSGISENQDYRNFLSQNADWLIEYALFMALKGFFGGKPWQEWPEEIRWHRADVVEQYQRELYFDMEFHCYLQFKFFEQYERLKRYANERNIHIIGDIPIYAAMDSADVWAEPYLFQLNKNLLPQAVAGCPPDGFSADGQLWGNPLYRWEVHRETGYAWWTKRLAHMFRLYDVTRIDHFRGFDAYYSIPYGGNTAEGHWEKGPGMELFRHVEQALGKHWLIAEDLGHMTDSARQLVQESGFWGMKVLEFAFDSRDTSANEHLPHQYPENCVVYTGTHDNQTMQGWFRSISGEEQKQARAYLWDWYTPQALLYRSFISLAMRSPAKLCIIPLQDYLGLDDRARINIPSTVGKNWQWRVKKENLTDVLAAEIRETTKRYGRL